METVLTAAERAGLEDAKAAEPRLRRWRRDQAVGLLAEGQRPAVVAAALDCAVSSVYHWAAAWRRAGRAGLREGDHGGGRPILDGAGAATLTTLLTEDPQAHGHRATGWTVPLLRTELAAQGYALSDRTLRRTLPRRGWRWKRPTYVRGRPDPAAAEKRGP